MLALLCETRLLPPMMMCPVPCPLLPCLGRCSEYGAYAKVAAAGELSWPGPPPSCGPKLASSRQPCRRAALLAL